MKIFAVIVAGGSGRRMNADIPKQFLKVKGMPILMHTISAFHRAIEHCEIVVVLPESEIENWKLLCSDYEFSIKHTIVKGGKERYHSVKNGLAECKGEGLVAVHDGARPIVSAEMIVRSFEVAKKAQAAIPVVDIAETVRELVGETSKTVDRRKYKLVQTPQVFDLGLLKEAYHQKYKASFTDDASVVESLGKHITLFEGEKNNIKITTQEDLLIAEAFLHA